MQPQTLNQEEAKYVETHHGIPVEEPKKKELPKRGTFLVMDGMPMVVLSMSPRARTLHLKWLTDKEIAEMVQKQQKWTDEDLAKMADGGQETE